MAQRKITPAQTDIPVSGLSDVQLGILTDGEVLTWNAFTSKWTNQAGGAGGGPQIQLMLLNSSANDTFDGLSNFDWTVSAPMGANMADLVNYDSYPQEFVVSTAGLFAITLTARVTALGLGGWPTSAPTAVRADLNTTTAYPVGQQSFIVRREQYTTANAPSPNTVDITCTFYVSGFIGDRFSVGLAALIDNAYGTDSTQVSYAGTMMVQRIANAMILG